MSAGVNAKCLWSPFRPRFIGLSIWLRGLALFPGMRNTEHVEIQWAWPFLHEIADHDPPSHSLGAHPRCFKAVTKQNNPIYANEISTYSSYSACPFPEIPHVPVKMLCHTLHPSLSSRKCFQCPWVSCISRLGMPIHIGNYMHMYVCMYVCMYVRRYVCMYVCMYKIYIYKYTKK